MIQAISILGSTGSVGRQTIAVAQRMGLRVSALTANRNAALLEEQARLLHPSFVALYEEAEAKQLRLALADTDIRVGSGIEGLMEAAVLDEAEAVITAVSGAVGLRPTLAATPGDLSLVLPKRILDGVIEMVYALAFKRRCGGVEDKRSHSYVL